MLQALIDSKGENLNNDLVIDKLKTLKHKAAEMSKKVEETDKAIGKIEAFSQQYMPFSQACSEIYFAIDSLHQIHFLYQYSLQFFLDIYRAVLQNNDKPQGITDPDAARLSTITSDLFKVCYERVARGMLHKDHLTLALLLCRIHLRGQPPLDEEFKFFLCGGKEDVSVPQPLHHLKISLAEEQLKAVQRLLNSELPAFKNLSRKLKELQELEDWLQLGEPEQSIPHLWDEEKPPTPIGQAMHRLLVIQAFRPDRLVAAARLLVNAVLGEGFMDTAKTELDLYSIVETELTAHVPALFCSVPGFDASVRVDDLAAKLSKRCASIAIGSAEGFSQAELAIDVAAESGEWVLLKNVHLAPQWLVQLEKKLHSLKPHASFRLFCTMEINPEVPVSLLRAGRIFVFELPPHGIRANLLRIFSTIPAAHMMRPPSERARLYFLLAWFHAIVQERLRYVPLLGWTKHNEFNESDLRVACDTLDTWIEKTAPEGTNLLPQKVPWDALVTLLSVCIYGGKIDNDSDQQLLRSMLSKLFNPRSFEADFALVDGVGAGDCHITMPDGVTRDDFLHWVESLDDRQITPSWLGLPSDAEKVQLLTTRGTDLVNKLLEMQQLEDAEKAYSSDMPGDP